MRAIRTQQIERVTYNLEYGKDFQKNDLELFMQGIYKLNKEFEKKV